MRLQRRREQKAREVTPHQRSTVERVLFKLEDDLLLERVLDPPRGIYLRVGSMGEGSGFALGPAFRYNTARFDFKASAAASTKTYFSGDVSLRFPGTVGQDSYFKSQGPYVELRGRHRSFPQEDFFGLGPDSQLSNRSDFALRDTLGRVTGGYQRGQFQTGIGLGYLDASTGAGTDARMPSSTEIFTIDEMPGVSDRGGFLVIEPFVEYASIDPAIGDLSGGRYRLSVTEYRDRTHDRVFVPPMGSGSPAIPDVRQGHTHDRDPCLDRLHHRGGWQRGSLLSATDAGRGTNAARVSHLPLSGSHRAAVAGRVPLEDQPVRTGGTLLRHRRRRLRARRPRCL